MVGWIQHDWGLRRTEQTCRGKTTWTPRRWLFTSQGDRPWKKPTLATHWYQTSILHCEKTQFNLLFKPPSLQCSVSATWAQAYRGLSAIFVYWVPYGLVTHLESDILECEVKWASGSIAMNKASGSERILAELFQVLKDAVKMLHSICQQIWKTQQCPQDWKRSVFISIPKKGNAKECSNYCTIAHILHTSKVMLKILQAGLQQHVNWELPDVQAGFRKGRGTRDQIANIHWITERQESYRKISTSALLIHQSLWLCGSQQTVKNSYRDGNSRPPYLPPEKSVCRSRRNRTGHGTTDWLQIGKGVHQGCILSPCLFNFYAEYITLNARLDEAQAGIKTAGRNINNLRYADDTTLNSRKQRGTNEPLDES